MSFARCCGLRRSQTCRVSGDCGVGGKSSSCIGGLLRRWTRVARVQTTQESIHNGAGVQQVGRRSEGAASVVLVRPRGARALQIGPRRWDRSGAPFGQGQYQMQSVPPTHVLQHIQCLTLKRVLLTDDADSGRKLL